jgi:fructose-1,6-bisphosphatase
VQRAHITGLVGYADGGGSINVQSEKQKTLDVMTNDVLSIVTGPHTTRVLRGV